RSLFYRVYTVLFLFMLLLPLLSTLFPYTTLFRSFYWLEEEGFNPLNQLDIVNGLRSEENRIGEIVQVTINNINANSKYLYTPYNLHSTKKEFDDVKTFDDSMLQSTRLFGNRLYSFDVTSDLVTRYPALATSIYSNHEDKDKADYLN